MLNKMTHCMPDVKRKKTFKGKKINKQGYILTYKPSHPNAVAGYIFEHRLVMEANLGRYLDANECVHHIDGNKQNNNIDNLKLMTIKEHNIEHHAGSKRKEITKKKLSEIALKRFANPVNHPFYKKIPADKIKRSIVEFSTVKDICRHLGISKKTFYNKLDELDLREWYESVK